jgi:hypothetical protein
MTKALVDEKTNKARLINEWFTDPEGFLDALLSNNFVTPGKPDESRLLQLLRFGGPMYQVFSPDDIETLKRWIVSLDRSIPLPKSHAPGRAIAELIDRFRDVALTVPAHQRMKLSGPDPADSTKQRDESVAWWFDLKNATTAQFMAALAWDKRYVVSGKPEESVLITKLLAEQKGMAQRLGPTGVQYVRDWIAAGTPAPEGGTETPLFAMFLDTAFAEASDGSAPYRRILGMGAVH